MSETAMDLSTDICGIPLSGPILNGSGTFDVLAAERVFGQALREDFPFDCYVSKTITLNPRPGNPPYRLWETPSGMINSIGLPGPGLDGFLERDVARMAGFGVPLIVSVMADCIEDFEVLVSRVAEREEVAGIELNVSCPNVHSGLIVGEQPAETEALMNALRAITSKPLIVKLTPNVANPHEVAVAAEQGGADAVSMINTVKAAGIDPRENRMWLGVGAGGLSGPAVRPIALAQVRTVSAAVSIPVIGMGGITDADSAVEFILAGARVVAVGTENFRDPKVGKVITDGLSEALRRRGLASLVEAQAATLA